MSPSIYQFILTPNESLMLMAFISVVASICLFAYAAATGDL